MTIVGNGDIATILPDRKDFTFFAAGVSNSQETRESEYQRERDLLAEQPTDTHLVYFSSLGVLSPGDSRYLAHKRGMEELIKQSFPTYTIVRIGNITWGKNPHTIINYLRSRLEAEESFEVHDVYRYVVDQEEFLYWVNQIPEWSCEISIPGRRLKVREIVRELIEGAL